VMKRLLAATLLLLGGQAQAATLITNAHGYTLDSTGRLQKFEALLIDSEGRVVRTGKTAALARSSPAADRVDAKGAVMLPGLIDAHGHVMSLGQQLLTVDLADTKSLDEALAKIKSYATANPDLPWITGGGWNQESWGLGRFPTAADLDSAVADRPVWLSRIDGHAGWANSKAMALAKITAQTKSADGGRIEKTDAGQPAGVFVDAAMQLVGRQIPPPAPEQRGKEFDAALKMLASVGLTSVHDAGMSADDWQLYTAAAEQGRLTVRISAMILGLGDDFAKLAKNGPVNSLYDDRLSLRSVKLMMDGALGSRGAALLEPYSDAPDQKGLMRLSETQLRNKMSLAMFRGFQVNVHAIGDAANRAVLDAFAEVQPYYATKNLRNRIEHAQIISPEDIERFHKLGVIASIQPTHATSDKNMAENRLGSERMGGAYAWRALLKSGAQLAGGSDFPVESPNPFYGWHAAVTRQDHANEPPGGWRPWDALTRLEAFRLFTLDAAYAGHQETVLGSLETGKWADFIIVDSDPFTVGAEDLWRIRVLQTWQAGKQVYEAPVRLMMEPVKD
jgi:predicted amidohydrolase YtcJ